MLKNNNGFTLTECLVSLLILTVSAQFLVPAFTHTLIEAKAIRQHQDALTLLHNDLIDWSQNDVVPPKQVNLHSTTYSLEGSFQSNLASLCIKWKIPPDRSGKECGEIKR